MRAVDLIRQKRDDSPLGPDAIQAFVSGVTDGSWPDYQIAALLMAIVWRGMSTTEAAVLTDAMVRSGERLDLSEFGAAVVDKHSTGGVGDKISIALAPLAAACGVIVPMMSGRGLGHTGGTLDKLESIPGFRTRLSIVEMKAVLRQTGCALVGQTDEIAPADRRLYALRDVTATVESVPLIAASILSKKIAEGAKGLVLDVKVGRGAFMRSEALARELAERLIAIAEANGLATEALLTAMDAPLGRHVGNAPEVVEAIEILRGGGPEDVRDLTLALAERMLVLAGIEADPAAARARAGRALSSGAALEKFRTIVERQGGDPRVIDDPSRLPQPAADEHVHADRSGFVVAIDAFGVGQASVQLGAGRDRADASVDPSAGIELFVREGESVRPGDRLARVAGQDRGRVSAAAQTVKAAITLGEGRPANRPLIIGLIARPVHAGRVQ